MLSKSYKLILTTIIIVILALVFDLILNIILPEKFKKTIGTTRNYSLKSIKFHHSIAPKINLNELWGDKKYKIKTNELSMRIGENSDFKIDNNKKYLNLAKKNIKTLKLNKICNFLFVELKMEFYI